MRLRFLLFTGALLLVFVSLHFASGTALADCLPPQGAAYCHCPPQPPFNGTWGNDCYYPDIGGSAGGPYSQCIIGCNPPVWSPSNPNPGRGDPWATCTCGGGGGGGGGQVCGDGFCTGTETNATCAFDCPLGGGPGPGNGGCQVGDPFTGLNNCGEVGRQPGSGSCGAGCMCCAFYAAPPTGCKASATVPSKVTMGLGDVVVIKTNFYGYDGGTTWSGFNINVNPPGVGSPNVVTASPSSRNMCCGIAYGYMFGAGDTRQNVTLVGVGFGTTNILVRGSNNAGASCDTYTSVTVVPGNNPTVNLQVNGTSGSTTLPAGGGPVNLTWASFDTTSCTASEDWSGSKVTSGSESEGVVTTPKAYTLTCDGPDGQAKDRVIVNVTGVSGLPLVDLRVGGSDGPVVVNTGQAVGISWNNLNIDKPRGCDLTSSPSDPTWNAAANPVTGAASGVGSRATAPASGQKTYTMTCYQNGNLAVSASDTMIVKTHPQCDDPIDLGPTITCSPDGVAKGSILWKWQAVPSADQYSILIRDEDGNQVATTTSTTPTGFKNAAFFGCTVTASADPTDICSIPTSLLPGNPAHQYHAEISVKSSSNACTPLTGTVTADYQIPPCNIPAWWQSSGGDIVTQGDVTSKVPQSVGTPENRIVQDGDGGYPGVVITSSGGSADPGKGVVSSTNWTASTIFNGRVPAYSDFVDLIPASVTPRDPNASGNASWANFKAAPANATDSNGYTWYTHTGDLTITDNIDISGADIDRKVILFVTGNLTINGKITIADLNRGFFMAIVGKNNAGVGGNISVAPSVTTTSVTPTLGGVFFCEGSFNTGTTGGNDGKLNILGSVAALGGVNLQRDLGVAANASDPAETFTVSPELLLNYPFTLTFKRPVWREVAP